MLSIFAGMLRQPAGLVKLTGVAANQAKDLGFRRLQADAVLGLTRIRRKTERRIMARLEEEGLDVTPAQANLLMVLFQERKPMNARALAHGMGLSEVTVGRFVRALERTGWVTRERDPDDARAYLLTPTAKAYTALPAFIRVSNAMLDAALAGLDRNDLERLKAIVDRIHDNLDQDR